MLKTLMQSVVSQLQKERVRLENELHRVTAALTSFGKVYLHVTKSGPAASRKKKNYLGCRAQADCRSSTETVGEDPGEEKIKIGRLQTRPVWRGMKGYT